MLFVIAGVLIMVLNVLDVAPFGAWNWNLTGDLWRFTVPFVLAVLWWTWADKSGLNRRREMARMEARKLKRRKEQLTAMGMDATGQRKSSKR